MQKTKTYKTSTQKKSPCLLKKDLTSVFQGHLTRAGKLYFRLNSLLFYLQSIYTYSSCMRTECGGKVPRSPEKGEQSENYFSKPKSLKRMKIPTKESLSAFKDKMPFFFFFPH